MTDKIILDIRHSDDYTDYLFLTAGLTNKRIIPLVNPGSEELKALKGGNTKVLRCFITRETISSWSSPVSGDPDMGTLRVNSRYYLDDDGTINYGNAEVVRQGIESVAMRFLNSHENLCEAYRHYFPLFWRNREKIYSDPRLFFVGSGRFGSAISGCSMSIGAILKAMDEDPGTFRIQLGGGCNCGERPLLIDYDQVYGEHWMLYTWCPACGSRREIRAWNFQRAWRYERSVSQSEDYYNKGQGRSPLGVFDLVEELRDSSLRSA